MIAVGTPASRQLGFVGDQANPKQLRGVSRGTRLRCGFLRAVHSASIFALFAITERRKQAQASRAATSPRVGVKQRGIPSAVPSVSHPASLPQPSALRQEGEESPLPCRSGNLNGEILSLDPKRMMERPRLAQICWQAETIPPASYSLEAQLGFRLRTCK